MLKYMLVLSLPFFMAHADHSPKVGAEMVAEAQKLMSEGMPVIDVRQEACEGYVKGAQLISIDDILAGSPQALEKIKTLSADKTKPIAIYCRSGARSAKVINYLKGIGYTKMHNLGGVGDYFNAETMQACN